MAELSVTEPGAGTAPARHMDLATFSRIVDILERERERLVVVSADGAPPPALPEMLERLAAGSFRAMVYAGDGSGWRRTRAGLEYVFDARAMIRRLRGSTRSAQDGGVGLTLLRGCEQASLYLGVASARPPVGGLLKLLAMAPNAKTVTVGVGWKAWADGPLPGARESAPRWSEGLLALVSELTDRGVQSAFGCGLTLCCFSRKQLGRLAGMNVRWPLAHCRPQFHIDPTGLVGYCRRIRRPAANLLEIGSLMSVREGFTPLQMMGKMCPRTGALPCRSGATEACGRGCLADALAGWHGGTATGG